VLGNKQLISLFFVVVALCGVFFAMGYMVRGNSIKGAAAPGTETAAPATEGQRQQPEPPPPSAEPPVTAPAPVTETKPAETPAPTPAPETVPVAAAPEAGATYLQVTALARSADAESVVRTLKEQHFPAMLGPNSKDGLFRVLIGPYHQTADVAEAKGRLKILGFAGAFVQKQ
jgi:cell division septation protein DedD